METSDSVVRFGMDITSIFDQKFENVEVSSVACIMKRGEVIVLSYVYQMLLSLMYLHLSRQDNLSHFLSPHLVQRLSIHVFLGELLLGVMFALLLSLLPLELTVAVLLTLLLNKETHHI